MCNCWLSSETQQDPVCQTAPPTHPKSICFNIKQHSACFCVPVYTQALQLVSYWNQKVIQPVGLLEYSTGRRVAH